MHLQALCKPALTARRDVVCQMNSSVRHPQINPSLHDPSNFNIKNRSPHFSRRFYPEISLSPFYHFGVKLSPRNILFIFSSLNLLGTEPWIFNYLPSLCIAFYGNSKDITSRKTQLALPNCGPLAIGLKFSNPIGGVSGKKFYFPLC